jgi:hypothetical protein
MTSRAEVLGSSVSLSVMRPTVARLGRNVQVVDALDEHPPVGQPPSCTACPTQVATSHAPTRKSATSAREIEFGTDSMAVFVTY